MADTPLYGNPLAKAAFDIATDKMPVFDASAAGDDKHKDILVKDAVEKIGDLRYRIAGELVPWTQVDGKPVTFPPSTHGHAWDEITAKPLTFAPSSHTHPSSEVSDFAAAVRAQIEAMLQQGANMTLTPAGSGATRTLTLASTGGGGGLSGLGSVDNSVLRTDGTGGNLAQGSAIVIEDASTGTQTNVQLRVVHPGQSNSALVLSPMGTAAVIFGPRPDGTATGGDARGSYAVDFQWDRGISSQVASGLYALNGGRNNTVSGAYSSAWGFNNSVSGNYAHFWGEGMSGNGAHQRGFGSGHVFDSNAHLGDACGRDGRVRRQASQVYSGRCFAAAGDNQLVTIPVRATTTGAGTAELQIVTIFDTTNFSIPANCVISGMLDLQGVSTDGSVTAHYMRKFCFKNVSGTTTLVSSSTIGTDDAGGTGLAITANDVSDYGAFTVTGVAGQNMRWTGRIQICETQRS